MMIKKDMLRRLISIGSKNIDIHKTFNAGRNLVPRCIKHHALADVLREPEDDNGILQMAREVHQFHEHIVYYYVAGHLRTKGIKVKQVGLRLMPKNLKNSEPISMDAIRRRSRSNRSSNAVWHIDSTHKLVK